MLKERDSSQPRPDPAGNTGRTDTSELFGNEALEMNRKAASVPFLGPDGAAPARVGQFVSPFQERLVWIPVSFEPISNLAAHTVFCDVTHADFPWLDGQALGQQRAVMGRIA